MKVLQLDWWEVVIQWRVELIYITMDIGVLCVMITGLILMLLLYVNNWDSMELLALLLKEDNLEQVISGRVEDERDGEG